jgi:hypothetical protein
MIFLKTLLSFEHRHPFEPYTKPYEDLVKLRAQAPFYRGVTKTSLSFEYGYFVTSYRKD